MNQFRWFLAWIRGSETDYSLSKVVTRGHTGRRIQVDSGFYRAQRLTSRKSLFPLRLLPWTRRVLRDLHKAPLVGSPLELFRGRPRDGSIRGLEQMGPPPVGCAPDGRYNRAGESVLYLSDSEEGVRLEVTAGPICIQQFLVPAPSLRIADFAPEEVSNRVHAAFDLAERACVPGRDGPNNYAFSQLLARSIFRAGFDGFIVPGVRGNSSVRYRNVVLLKPDRAWQSWSAGPKGFREDT
jgi:hypothetical protein